MWHIYAAAFVLGGLLGINTPARLAIVRDWVDHDNQMNAVVLNSAVMNSGRSWAWPLAGAVIEWFGMAPTQYLARGCGLSPRVRGNRIASMPTPKSEGSIPACAGEPSLSTSSHPPSTVYPRVCGGTQLRAQKLGRRLGLSPRVRGNPTPRTRVGRQERSIPACAGEPRRQPPTLPAWPVYPRVCGGTSLSTRMIYPIWGLSPRVRGNPVEGAKVRAKVGSIPACAGEPGRTCTTGNCQGVYPRVCGGTVVIDDVEPGWHGLSPRVRGNRHTGPSRAPDVRSIPACAGEPDDGIPTSRDVKVYPRVCGGTSCPAHRREASMVYPRVCGGTSCWVPPVATNPGLSPRVRGNPERVGLGVAFVGSIPACAGEPHSSRDSGGQDRVYPRVCGGTIADDVLLAVGGGLSPRVRGNRNARAVPLRYDGSIPACAGEPVYTRRVYPRVCGGTVRACRNPCL